MDQRVEETIGPANPIPARLAGLQIPQNAESSGGGKRSETLQHSAGGYRVGAGSRPWTWPRGSSQIAHSTHRETNWGGLFGVHASGTHIDE